MFEYSSKLESPMEVDERTPHVQFIHGRWGFECIRYMKAFISKRRDENNVIVTWKAAQIFFAHRGHQCT